MKRYVIDRIEGDFAVLVDDNGNITHRPLSDFPSPPKENTVVNDKLIICDEETKQRKQSIRSRFDQLKKKGN